MTNDMAGGAERHQPMDTLLHELRTALAAILGWAELPLQGLSDDPELPVRALRHIHDEAERMYEGIQRVFPRSVASPVIPTRPQESVDLREIVDQAVTALGVLDPSREITTESAGSTTLVTDARLLWHIVRNLLTNAIRHTPGGTPIALSTRGAVTGPGGQSSVELTVRDHGAGLPASLIAWLSTPEPPTDRADAAGTDGGMGLLFVKSVVGLLGGQIRARGDATFGTTVVVTFPTVRQSHVDEWRQRQP